MILKLERQTPEGDAVRGVLYRDGQRLCPTLENLRYIIPPGRYRLTVTYSPKFKRLLPLVNQVEGRSGIRFHVGSKPEHSRGCILVNRADERMLVALLQTEPDVCLEIVESSKLNYYG